MHEYPDGSLRRLQRLLGGVFHQMYDDLRNQRFSFIYRLLGIDRGDVWVFWVYAPTEHFATFPAMLTHIF